MGSTPCPESLTRHTQKRAPRAARLPWCLEIAAGAAAGWFRSRQDQSVLHGSERNTPATTLGRSESPGGTSIFFATAPAESSCLNDLCADRLRMLRRVTGPSSALLHPHRFDVYEFVNAVYTEFAPMPGLFYATEGQARV